MIMTNRKIDFPDHTADDFDPNVVVTHNGVNYTWNGYGWEVIHKDVVTHEELGQLGQRISDGEEAQEELDGRVSRGESAQMQIATQVVDNKNAIDELRITKGSVSKYEVKQVSVGVASRDGELIVDSPNAADVTFISFAAFDLNGQPTKPIQAGDIVEFIQAAARNTGDVTRYKVKDAPNQQSVSVDYLAGNNDFAVGEQEECYIYPQNAETASVEYVDTRVSECEAGLTEYVDQQLAGLDFDTDVDLGGYATEQYVDDAIAAIPSPDLGGYLANTGQQDLNPDVWKVRQPNSEGKYRSFINIHNGEMNLYNVVDPSGSGHEKWAANKEYVDAQIASIGNVNLDNYLPLAGGDLSGRVNITMPDIDSAAIRTIGSINVKSGNSISGDNNFIAAKDYVRVFSTPVTANDVTHKGFTDATYTKKTALPGLIFAFESGGAGTVSTGKFRWYIDNSRRLKISATTKSGIPWGVDSPIGDMSFGNGHMFTIYTTVSGTNNWRIKQTGTIDRIDWHSDDILCYVSYHAENGSFSTSAEYGITISGLF